MTRQALAAKVRRRFITVRVCHSIRFAAATGVKMGAKEPIKVRITCSTRVQVTAGK
jgi:hypothetical protein